ncbi:MAG: type IV pili methyl-accepting chemotaxis transducer N-terminal domain-containing protein [Hylemonella sp.]|uniref:type IV pili methyl-accepting chemotaxis transducer N-terminal domain-containing protein n=1 Tax=Hylemonella sp. TaxID=2066020 RepID=UPI0022BAC6E7|nr:type IV pili methyl-accepting chemotaxis transducer N-terminal domain-containing protein [Hylemonella sp.]MCZ8252099.1 type IV pili methyl-accepting chemotaxis transducer N-terminal domain-containing protein [Hylemonella sp.]
MKRRELLLLAAAAPFAAQAQVLDLNDAINKAGRQRMLSQRMAKAWLALVHKTESGTAKAVLERSMALFDRQLVELKAYAPNAELRKTYADLETAWSDYKALLVGKLPSQDGAAGLLNTDARVLALAHQGTVQYEAVSNKPVGKLVNVAGRQRMLSQRMAKYFYAAALKVEPAQAQTEIGKARTEFLSAMELLRNAPEATAPIKDQLALADNQWLFFDMALKEINTAGPKALSDMFVTSENLLSVMDRITGLYAGLKA